MKITQIRTLMLASVVVVSSLVVGEAAFSQTRPAVSVMPEPTRWTQEDVTTSQKLATAQKEMAAAKFEAMNACKTVAPTQHASCVAEAESIYSQDLAAAQKRLYPNK